MTSARRGSKGVPRADREQQILAAACEEFGRRGFSAMSVAAVAATAGISKPLIYSYFGSKEGLYLACVTRAGEALVTNVAEALASPKRPFEMGPAVLQAIFTALEERPSDWNVIFDRSLPRNSEAERVAKHYRVLFATQAAQGIGATFLPVLPDPLDQSALVGIWMNVVAALVEWWIRNPGQTPGQMVARYERIVATIGAQ